MGAALTVGVIIATGVLAVISAAVDSTSTGATDVMGAAGVMGPTGVSEAIFSRGSSVSSVALILGAVLT